MIERIVNNIYWRNLAVIFLIVVSVVTQKFGNEQANLKLYIYSVLNVLWVYPLFLFHNLVLYEKFLAKRKYVLYVALLGVVLIADLRTFDPVARYFLGRWPNYSIRELIGLYWTDLFFVYVAFGIYLAFKYFKEREAQLSLVRMQRELELKQLKQQFNPHFLFNALNNIYSYSIEHANSRTNELILKLSELMRFIIVSSSQEEITIDAEVDFIENYIAFERERLGERCNVSFEKHVEDGTLKIAPFIFFTLVENAFKHGTDFINEAEIEIKLTVAGSGAHFAVRNSMVNPKQTTSTNIGLDNIRRRMALLYPEKHIISLNPDGKGFKAEVVLLNIN